MLREHDSVLKSILMVVDLVMVIVAFYLAYFLRQGVDLLDQNLFLRLASLDNYLNLIPLCVFLWGASLQTAGAYEPFRGREIPKVLWTILKGALIATLLFTSFAFLMKLHYLSRSFMLLVFSIATLMLLIQRTILMICLKHFRQKGLHQKHVLLIGTGQRAQKFIKLIEEHPEWGLIISGLVDKESELKGQTIMNYPVLGVLEDIPDILSNQVIDEVIFVVPRSWLLNLEEAILYCETVGKRVSIATGLYSLEISKAKQVHLPGFPLLMFQSTSDKIGSLWLKRFLDIAISFCSLLILMPFLILIGILVKATSKGPVLFKQVRSGLNGRTFTMYKFRSMEVGAQAKLENLMQQNEMTGPAFKMEEDPRVTPFGKWLRKSSMDELPQLWNVFLGDMSMVGPRPPIPDEVKKYEPWHRRRLSMRPGLTCIWQISGRNKVRRFDRWMEMDLDYIDHWSLGRDLKIFFKTIPVVLFWIGSK